MTRPKRGLRCAGYARGSASGAAPMPNPPHPSGMEPELGTGSRSEEAERWYQAQGLYREAQIRLVRQDRPGAAALLREALQRSPQHAEARALLATIEEIEQQERGVQASRPAPEWAEIQRRLESRPDRPEVRPEARLARGLSSLHLPGPLGMGVAMTSGVLGMIGGIIAATTLVLVARLGTALPYGGYWMMGPLGGGMFCGAVCGLLVYFYLERRPILAVLLALGAALLAGAIGGVLFPVVMLLLALAGLLRWMYRLVRQTISRWAG